MSNLFSDICLCACFYVIYLLRTVRVSHIASDFSKRFHTLLGIRASELVAGSMVKGQYCTSKLLYIDVFKLPRYETVGSSFPVNVSKMHPCWVLIQVN